jgi:hypothetical protein
MPNGQGLHWVTNGVLRSDATNDHGAGVGQLFGATGNWFTHETIASYVGSENAVVVPVNGREHAVCRMLQRDTSGATTAANGAEVWVWGVTGFGEYGSEVYNQNKVMAVRLAGVNYSKGNRLTESTTVVMQGPDGNSLAALDSDHGANNRISSSDLASVGPVYAALSEMKVISSDTPDAETMHISSVSSGEGGVFQLGGISPFHALVFTLDRQSHTAIRLNIAIGMH